MSDRLFKYLFLIPLLFVYNLSFAQDQGLLKDFLTVEDGLSNDEVTSIVQDNDGFIWIGTRGGLNRFDGYEFEVFNQVPGDSNSLVNPSIESLFVDSKGNIWIGSKSGGVSKYNPDTGKFRNIISNYNHTNTILPDNRILSFYEDKSGRMWMGTWEKGLVIFDESKNFSVHHLNTEMVNSITETSAGKIWVGTNEGLYEYDEELDSLIQHNKLVCQEIKYDKERNVLWIVADGLVKFDLRNNKSVRYKIEDSDLNSAGIIHSYQSVLLTKQGEIWVGTWGTGFYSFDPLTESFKRVYIYPEIQAALNKDYDAVLEIFQDRDENLWLGTNGGGICILKPKLDFNTVGFHPQPNKGLVNTRIMTVVDDKNGNLWLGTIGSGLIWSPDRVNFYPVKYPKEISDSRFFIIKYLFEDKNGMIWAGTNAGTYNIVFVDSKPQMLNVVKKYDNPDFNYQVVSMLDANGMFWLGTLQNGLLLFDRNTFRLLKHQVAVTNNNNLLQSNRISYLFQDSKDRIWVGTYNGLHVFNRADTLVQIAERYFRIDGDFTGNIITCIDEDQNGNIWIGTPNGLNKLNESEENNFSVKYYTESEGLASNFVKGISHDSKGNIWVSTNAGISKFNDDKENKTAINYNEMDGVGGRNFTEASVFKNTKGEIFFGGSYGLTYFQPEKVEALPTANTPVFTGLKIFNQPVSIHQSFGNHVILSKALQHAQEIVIPYRFNNFEIQFSSLDYKDHGRNNYAYILENHDLDWNYIGPRRFINFNNLKPGEYVLKVKSSNSHNVWNEIPKEISIKILPPFWQTWYALVFYILLVTGIVSVIRWNAVKQVRLANNLEMEKFQHDQDQKINDLKLRFFTNISHEFRTPLTLILAPLKELLGKREKYKLTDETYHKITIIQNNSNRLMKLVNQLLDFRKVESGNMKLSASETNFAEFVDEVCRPFFELASINNIIFRVNTNLQTKNIWIDRDKLEIILNNLVSNAFKYIKENGKIEVAVYEEEDEVLLSVSDNGPGIPKTEISNIFDRFYRVGKSENYGSTGIGLALVKRFTELHKGTISVTSEQNINTEFVVALPKGTKHLHPDEIVEAEKPEPGFVRKDQFFGNTISVKGKTVGKSDECILIVEDNPDVNGYLVDLLESAYKVESAKNGLEGYQKAFEIIPDLIISDVMMPELDGFELCSKIRENKTTATIPFVFLTAKSDEQFKLLGTQIGADDFISKPFDPNLLTEKVNNILTNRKKLQKQFSRSVRLEPSDIEITSHDEILIEKAILIIEANLQNHNFSSDVLASELNMSNSSLYRKLKELTGSSIAEFIRSIRIKRAGQLLADKTKTITEIAYEVGFNDVKHFRTVFQKHFGCSPSEYRDKT